MEAILIYELKVAASIAVFYAFYRLMLSKETLHRLNRIVLIATAVLSFVLPFCVITIHKTVNLPIGAEGAGLSVTNAAATEVSQPETEWWWIALLVLYGVGVLACLLKVGISALSVWRLIKSGTLVYEPDGSKVVIIERNIAPCSWMNWIIICREDYKSNCREIMEHEKAHIELGHSKDVLVVDILTAFQWFNPMMWMLRADLRAIHEFEADDAVLKQGVNIKEYLYLLIKKAISESGYSVTNSFNHSILKNRITMMSKSKTQLKKGLKVLYVIPLVCLSLALYAEEKVEYNLSGPDKDNTIALNQEDSTRKTSIKINVNSEDIDVNSEPVSIKIVGSNGREYMVSGRSKSIPTSTVSIMTQNDKEATTVDFSKLNITVDKIESVQIFKGENAVEKFGEKAAAGVMLIKLKDGSEKITYLEESNAVNVMKIVKTGKGDLKSSDKVVYVVEDGKETYYTFKEKINEIKPDEIESMNVYKDETYIKKYTEGLNISEAVDGVVVIKLKK